MSVVLKVALCAFVLVQCGRVFSALLTPESPCPQRFRYEEDDNITDGIITLDVDGSGIYDLEVNMSIPLDTNETISITSVHQQLLGGIEIAIYHLSFPFQHSFPKMTSIKFNGKIVCTGPPEVVTAEHGVTPLSARHYFTTSVTTSTTTTLAPPPDDKCGLNIDYKPLIFSGHSTRIGEYPWLVALFIVEYIGRYSFLCGGSLVSKNHVITAAHCMKDILGTRVSKNDLIVVLGKQNLTNWVQDSTIRAVKTYHIHPQYSKPADNDIAVVVLDQPVSYSVTIRAVCMWDEEDDLRHIVDKKGTVAGWGKDESGLDWVEEPKQIELPIVSQETCLRSDSRYLTLTSTRTFCAGNVNETRGPCTGDSGSGFVMHRNGVWKLRGIVSIALTDPKSRICDVNNYIVFTDVPKYATWVKEKIGGH